MLAKTEATLTAAVQDWLGQLERALAATDAAQLQRLFHGECYWRDILALTWSIDTVIGPEAIAAALAAHARQARPTRFEVDPARTAPRRVKRAGTAAIEAIFRFETAVGRGSGVLRLMPDAGDGARPKAWTLLTALEELKEFPERVGRSRPTGQSYSRDFRGPNWLDQRKAAAEYTDRDPTVLVVGGGQAGLSIAARLTQLGVDTLIVDRWARIGDNWRQRYHALTLHNQVHVNHLPYMPFPPSWPSLPAQGQACRLVRGLCGEHGAQLLAGDGVRGRHLRRGRGPLARRPAPGGRLNARRCARAMSSSPPGVSGIPNIPRHSRP